MRTIAIIILLGLSPEAVTAQTAIQCSTLPRAGDLLACYNGIAPQHVPRKQVTPKAPTVAEKRDTAATVQQPHDDMLEAENKKLGAKLKTICRNC